jgi:hypothetical protein
LPIEPAFGSVELRGKLAEPADPFSPSQQLYVLPVLSAHGRYSVGLSSIPTEDVCDDPSEDA